MPRIFPTILLAALAALPAIAQDLVTTGPADWSTLGVDWSRPVVIRHDITKSGRLDVPAGATLRIEDGGILRLDASLVVRGTFRATTGQLLFSVADDRKFVGNTEPGPDASNPDDHSDTDIGLWGMSGSTVHLNGPEVTPWLDAMPRAESGTSIGYGCTELLAIGGGTATLGSVPVGWQPCDKLVLTNLKGQTALATLLSIDGTTLKYQGAADFVAPALQCGDRTLTPKIANLSRRLLIASTGVKEGNANHRAHTVMMHHGSYQMSNVELRDLGPRGKLGRYPYHIHHGGMAAGGFVRGCSAWQTTSDHGNRGYAIHGTNDFTVERNLAYKTHGHAFFLEDGSEIRNALTDNLSILCNGKEELAVKNQITENAGPAATPAASSTSHFWLRSGNAVKGNVAIGGSAQWAFISLATLAKPQFPEALLEDCQAYGINGWMLAQGADNTKLTRPIAAYCSTAATSKPIAFVTPLPARTAAGLQVESPAFVLNGMGSAQYGAQVFLSNYSGVEIAGGLFAGPVGFNVHYNSTFKFSGVKIVADFLADPTYWQLTGNLNRCDITATTRMWKGSYPKTPQVGAITIQNCTGAVNGKSVNGKFTHGTNTALGAGVPEQKGALRLNAP